MADFLAQKSYQPLVSLGVPVFNAERFLPQALDSLLGQTLSNFELIISDNASTDRTQAICEEYVIKDRRVRYIRQKKNIGAPRNWNFLVNEANGIFFKWSSANDYCSPWMLEKCVEVMEDDPEIVLCYGRTQLIDDDQNPIKIYERDKSFNENRPSDRFEKVFSNLIRNNIQCGVFRLDILRLTRLDRLYPSGDLSLMAELALYGRFQMLPDVLLFRRQSRETFTSMLNPLERQRVYDPEAKFPLKLLQTRRHLDNLISILRAPLSLQEKLRAYFIALKLIKWDKKILWFELLSLFKEKKSSR